MKRKLSIVSSLLFIIAVLSACNNDTSPSSALSPDSEISIQSVGEITNPSTPIDGIMLTSQIKEQYAETELYTYTEPLYNLPRDHQFVLKGEAFKHLGSDLYGIVNVYASANFTTATYVNTRSDYTFEDDKRTLSPSPYYPAYDMDVPQTEAESEEYNKRTENKCGWGNALKYYLVRYIDLDTGEKLEKPLVTLFTIKAELDAPQMKFNVDESGRLMFYWEPVEGATSYIVGETLLENGAPISHSFNLMDTVTDPEWRGVGDAVTPQILTKPEWYKNSAWYQNRDLYDYSYSIYDGVGFYVIAMNDDGNSSISNIVTFEEFASVAPLTTYNSYQLYGEDGSLVLKCSGSNVWVDDVDSAPIYQAVEMMDGSIKQFVIDYPDTLEDIDLDTYGAIITKTLGTLFMNGIVIEDLGGRSMTEVLNYLNERENEVLKASGGVVFTDIPINDTPFVDIEFDDMADIEHEQLPLIMYNTPDVYANSALSAYLAINFVNHIETIWLIDFPEAADGSIVVDAITEAYFQNNAYIGGIELNEMNYNFKLRVLTVSYAMTEDEQKNLQSSVNAKVDEIVSQIISPDMSSYQKEEAINNYLCANSDYDFDALSDMLAMPYGKLISDKYKYSQTAYGVLVNGKGICQSYAEAFKILADKAELESVVVTGVLTGAGGHAWNRVLIDEQWFTLDVTNNDSNDLYNEFFNMPDEVAMILLTEDRHYLLDSELYRFKADKYGYDYFSQNGMCSDVYGLEQYLIEHLESGEPFYVAITDFADSSTDEITTVVQNVRQKANISFSPKMYLWVLRINMK